MDSSTYLLLLFVVISSQFQVVAAWQVAVGATCGFIAFVCIVYFLRYCVFDKQCSTQVEGSGKKEPVERKVQSNQPTHAFQVGHQPYQGDRPPPQYQQPPMPQGHHMPPPMHNDPAYPPSMPAGGGYPGQPQPASNPFKSASHGY